jgi:cobalt-zinc-cadmium efflux system membrane fusion protein
VDLTGEVVADPDQMARVTGRIAGRVAEVRFKEGQRVHKGQVLCILESAELARARSTLTSVAARSSAAAENAARMKGLAAGGLVTVQQVSAAQAEASALAGEVVAARQALSAFGATAEDVTPEDAPFLAIRAPVAGMVIHRDAVVGQTTSPDTLLATVVNLQRVYFHARLFEKSLGDVRPGAHADVRLNAYPSESFAGVVETVGNQVDPTARTMVARIALKNHDDLLRLGLFGTARVVANRPAAGPQVLTIPLTAVTRLAEGPVAFVAHPDGDFEVHPVKLGEAAAGRVQVLEGLRPGEKVAVEGVFTLKSLVMKSTFGEEE